MDWKKTGKQMVIAATLMALGYYSTSWMMGDSGPGSKSSELEKTLAELSKPDHNTGGSAYSVGDSLQGSGAKAKSQPLSVDASFKEVEWDHLMPANWDPMEAFRGQNIAELQDNDPKAKAALAKMKAAWDNAPVNPAMNGQKVRIPGFAIPIEQSDKGVSEFLLVPYFGACIHTPPPPANQIIHVKLNQPEPAVGSMQPYWVWGEMQTQRHDNELGDAAYRLVATGLQPYED